MANSSSGGAGRFLPFEIRHLPRHLRRDELVFTPVDAASLAPLAEDDGAGHPGLAEALAAVTEAAQQCDCYVVLTREELPRPLESVIVGGGRYAVDLAPDGRVAGVGLLDRLPCRSGPARGR